MKWRDYLESIDVGGLEVDLVIDRRKLSSVATVQFRAGREGVGDLHGVRF